MLHERFMKSCNVKVENEGNNFTLGILLLLIAFTFCIVTLQAQETIPSSGSNAIGSGGSISYTIGQVNCSANTGTNGSVLEGVQQPYEISVAYGIEEEDRIDLAYEAYPNPATGYLMLRLKDFNNENLSYLLYDIKGNNLESKKITTSETNIDISNLSPSTYFLKLILNTKVVKSFKIIKN